MVTDKKKLAAIISVVLAILMVIGSLPLGVFVDSNAYDLKAPPDTVTIKKISDGTHDGHGTSTFVNSKNGYSPGDDNENDGVVTSGDYVKYYYKMSITAGPRRTLVVTLGSEGDGLSVKDALIPQMSSGVITGSSNGNIIKYSVPRGAVGEIEGVIKIKAKDTKGKVSKGNILTATLSNGDYKFVSKSDPVTVVSVPFSDLTIYTYGSCDQNDTGGVFTIEPYVLKPQGYSKNGITTFGEWHADVDVSDFPKGVKWFFEDKEIIPVNGVLKDLRGQGKMNIKYDMPKDKIPTKDSKTANYYIHLIPYRDSLKAGDNLNIEDIGAGKPIDYDTSKVKINGVDVFVKDLSGCKNNNWSYANWRYFTRSDLPIKVFNNDFCGPRDWEKVIFDKANIYYSDLNPWYRQAFSIADVGIDSYSRSITSDNDMFDYITIFPKYLNINSENIMVGVSLNAKKDMNGFVLSKFDTTKGVVVTVDKRVISPSLYTVEYREVKPGIRDYFDNTEGATKWIRSQKAPNERVNQVRIIFKKDAFKTGANSPSVNVCVPSKAFNNYDTKRDNEKLINHGICVGVYNGDDVKALSDTDIPYIDQNTKVRFPTKPKMTSTLYNVSSVFDKNKNVYETNWNLYDIITNPLTSGGYDVKRVFTFDDVYDVDSFELVDGGDYVAEKTGPHEITVTNKNTNLYKGSDWCLDRFGFNINTVYALSELDIRGKVKEDVYVTYPSYGEVSSATLHSSATDSVDFIGFRDASSFLSFPSNKLEIGEDLEFNVKVSSGNQGFSQDIILPYDGDYKTYIPKINKANDSNIDIDYETGRDKNGYMDGIGRSRFSGSYKLRSIKLKVFEKSTEVKLKDGINDYILPVKPNGEVDISKVANIKLGSRPCILQISSDKRLSDIQSGGVDAYVSITPSDSVLGNDYVVWLDNTKSKDKVIVDKIAWPSYATTVSSDISGYVFNDANRDYKKDNSESGYAGVCVKLLKKQDDKYLDTGLESITDLTGKYSFSNLKHSDYRVVLKNVERDTGISNKVISLNGSKEKDARDGSLKLGRTNRFSVYENLVQTCSFSHKKDIVSDSKADISLGYDDHFEGVDFGFFLPNHDLALDKKPTVTKDLGDMVKVDWDVDIKNTGNDFIKGVKLKDAMSKDIKDVKATLGYNKLIKEGSIIVTDSTTPSNFELVSTDQGVYLVSSDGVTCKKLDGIEGQFVTMSDNIVATTSGAYMIYNHQPIKIRNIDERVNFIASAGLSSYPYTAILATDSKCYYMSFDGMEIDEVRGIEGKIYFMKGHGTLSSSVAVLGTDKGVYYINERRAEKITGIQGKIKDVVGCYSNGVRPPLPGEPGEGESYLAAVVTDKGLYIVNKSKRAYKAKGIDGDIIQAVGFEASGGVAVATTKDVFTVDFDGTVSKIEGIEGYPLTISGTHPLKKECGLFVGTTEGCYLVDTGNYVTKVNGIEGVPKMSAGDFPLEWDSGTIVSTNKGMYIINSDSSDDYRVIKVDGIEGKVLQLKSYGPAAPVKSYRAGSAVITTNGLFLVNEKGKVLNTYYTSKLRGEVDEIIEKYNCSNFLKTNNASYFFGNDVGLSKFDTDTYGPIFSNQKIYGQMSDPIVVKTDRGLYSFAPSNKSVKEIGGIIGADLKVFSNGDKSYSVAATSGYYIASSPNDNLVKVEGINVEPTDVFGDIIPNTKSLVKADREIYTVVKNGNSYKAEKQNFDGDFIDIPYNYDKNIDNSYMLTTAGIYKMKGKASMVDRGTYKFISDRDEGSKIGYVVADDYNVYSVDSGVKKISHFDRKIKDLKGYLVFCEDGLYLNSNGRKLDGIDDTYQYMSGDFKGEDGGYIFMKNANSIVYLRYDKDGKLLSKSEKKIDSTDFKTNETCPFIYSNEALYKYGIDKENVENISLTKLLQFDSKTIKKEFIKDEDILPDKSDVFKNDEGHPFILREYSLPEIAPNDVITAHFEGYILKTDIDKIYANQAFVTSDVTPRENPKLPKIPSIDEYNPVGIYDGAVLINTAIDIEENGKADDLGDQVPVLIPKNSKPIKMGKISGFAWYDTNKNGIKDKDEGFVANCKVDVFDKSSGIMWSELFTDDKGFWSVDAPLDHKYEIHYNVVGFKGPDGQSYIPTKSKVGGDSDSDIDSDGYVIGDISPLDEGSFGNIGNADAGIVPIKAGISVTKGKKHHSIEKVYGNFSLGDNTKPVDFSYTESDGDSVDDNDGDDRTAGYKFDFTNTGELDLSDIHITDETIKGNKAYICKDLFFMRDGKTIDKSVKLSIKDGYLANGDDRFTMPSGSKVVGTLSVFFTKDNSVHHDKLTVDAKAYKDKTLVSSVRDFAELETEYIHRPNRTLKIGKYGVKNIDDKDKNNAKRLEGVAFEIMKVKNPESNDVSKYSYESLGEYTTDENGEIDIALPSGEYRIVEKENAKGYDKPDDSGWFVSLSWDVDKVYACKVSADAKMPYSEVIASKDDKSWGEVRLYNYKHLNIPITGGNMKIFMFGGIAMLLLGSVIFVFKKREK